MTRGRRRLGAIDVRGLAGKGRLTRAAYSADPDTRRRLFAASGDIIYPLILGLSRRHEIERGHYHCAAGIPRLEPECLDRVHDDVEAAVADFIRNAKAPIHNVEGWVRARLNATTVDAYRRRRGARGALQRPRLTRWLIEALPDEPWMRRLALEVLEWVGVERTAGVRTWPLSTWLELRTSITGDYGSTEQIVADDVETVLAAMRRKPDWYQKYVVRPLSMKVTPVLPGPRVSVDPGWEPVPLALVEEHEREDDRLIARAAVAVSRLARLNGGDITRQSVVESLRAAFCSGTGSDEIDRLPGAGSTVDEQLDALLADPTVVDRVVAAIPEIVGAAQR